MGNNLDLSISLLADGDGVPKVTSAAINLDAVVQEFLEGGEVEDLVVHRLRGIDDVL